MNNYKNYLFIYWLGLVDINWLFGGSLLIQNGSICVFILWSAHYFYYTNMIKDYQLKVYLRR